MTFRVIDEVPIDPATARVYAEGWQSWSPTTWYAAGSVGVKPTERWQHTMRFRPGVRLSDSGLQGEGLLVVDPGGGQPARCYGAQDATTDVPTIRARLDADHATVEADGEVEPTRHVHGGEAAVAAFAEAFAARTMHAPPRTAPTVWCSWYRYFDSIAVSDIADNLAALDEQDLGVDVVQIDDGWSRGLGEWLRPTDGFADLPRLVDSIKETGRQVGLWVAPFLVGEQTSVARQHPDWLVGEAGRNWDQDLLGLDLTHPEVRDYLGTRFARLRDLGIGYLKLDFLYAGAVPGERHDGQSTPTAAYRSGMELIRETVGPDVYLLGCGAPILPSVGLVDAMRVSPDIFHPGGQDGSSALRGLRPLAARAWQHGRFWVNDPDCLVARPSYSLRVEWADAISAYGGLRSSSDRIVELDDWGLQATRRLLSSAPAATPLPDDVVRTGARLASTLLTDPANGRVQP